MEHILSSIEQRSLRIWKNTTEAVEMICSAIEDTVIDFEKFIQEIREEDFKNRERLGQTKISGISGIWGILGFEHLNIIGLKFNSNRKRKTYCTSEAIQQAIFARLHKLEDFFWESKKLICTSNKCIDSTQSTYCNHFI